MSSSENMAASGTVDTAATGDSDTIRSPAEPKEGEVSMTIRLRDIVYVAVTIFNVVPVILYLPSAQIITAEESSDVIFYLWLICSALGMIFLVNLLSIMQITFMSHVHRVSVALVPFLIAFCYTLSALDKAPRFREPLSGRAIYGIRYLAWLVTVPVLLIESGPLCGYPPTRFAWVAVLTNAYIACAFGALLASTYTAKWFWITVSFGTTFLSMYETFCLLAKYPAKNRLYVCIMNAVFILYGAIYLAAAVDSIPIAVEVVCFGVCDIFAKAVFSSFMFNTLLQTMYQELIFSMRYAEDIVDRSVAPMFVLRCGDGRITRWNSAMAQIVNKTAEEVVGKAFIQEFLADSVKEAQDHFALALTQDLPIEEKKLIDVRIVHRSENEKEPQKVVDLIMSINRIDNTEGEKVLMCVGQDVTDLRSFRMLEQKKAQMLAVVSHELRSPLHGIIGITESAQKSATKSSQKRQLRLIADCAKRLVDFVTTMMDLTSMQKKSEFLLNNDPVDIVKLLDDVALLLLSANDKCGRAMKKESVSLVCDYRASRLPKLPIMEGDAYRLTQVFFNIIGNALKFTDKGSVEVSAQMRSTCGGEKLVVVIVKDTGKGICPTALPRIFEPFEQEDSTDTRQHAGLGLGLAISREIVRKHGGDINVESKIGVGSTFFILLPFRQKGGMESASETQSSVVDEPPPELSARRSQPEENPNPPNPTNPSMIRVKSNNSLNSDVDFDMDRHEVERNSSRNVPPATIMESPTSAGQRTTANGGHKRIRVLSVDDEPVNQEVIRGLFEDAPRFEVEAAMNGYEALEMLHATQFDIVLMDLMMPGMSGVEVLVKIRRTPKLSHLPVVMVSAKNQSDVISDALWKGATDFFVKPLDCLSLLARIDRILNAPLTDKKGQETSSEKGNTNTPFGAQGAAVSNFQRSATETATSPNQHVPALYAALALAFTADSAAALQLLGTVFTYVERTVELVAERTCRSADGSMLILAEGNDSEARLRRIAEEVRIWFAENVGGGLRLSIGIAAPSELHTASIGEQFVALGTSVGVAISRALHAAHGFHLSEASDTPSEIRSGILSEVRLNGTTAPASVETVGRHPSLQLATVNKTPLDVAREQAAAGDLVTAKSLYRLVSLLRAQCNRYETRLGELAKTEGSPMIPPMIDDFREPVKRELTHPKLTSNDKEQSGSGSDGRMTRSHTMPIVGDVQKMNGADSDKSFDTRPTSSTADLPIAPPGVLSNVKKSSRLAKMKQKIGVEMLPPVTDKSESSKYEACYAQMEKLGTGSSSNVYRALQKQTGKFVAVKRRTHANEEVLTQVKQEFDLLRLCKHRSVVQALDIIGTNLILELLSGPSLQTIIEDSNGLEESDGRLLCKQLVEVVFYLHQKGVCHRDIKPANIHLIGEELETATLKLLDFNTACFYDRMATVTGTVDFMAPEILKGWEYDERIDVWSVGVTAFMMLTNVTPCKEEEEEQAADTVMFVKNHMTSNLAWMEKMSPQARSFVQLTLIADNSSRPTARTLIAHMWLHENLQK
jgi:signal transduction histidine kinase/serine/threonine protein kinase/CheY-like chemotaxis protein